MTERTAAVLTQFRSAFAVNGDGSFFHHNVAPQIERMHLPGRETQFVPSSDKMSIFAIGNST